MPKKTESKAQQAVLVERANLLRRLMALLYDFFLIAAIWFAVAGLGVGLNGGEELPSWANHYLLFPALILSTFLFYYWFWTHGGQTLGMRAWRLKVINLDKIQPSFTQCLKRFSAAVLSAGLGFLTCPFHPEKKSLQDIASDTQIILLPKDSL